MGFGLDLGARVLHRDSQTALAHRRQIDHVVAHESGLSCGDAVLFKNLCKHRRLVLNPLVHVINLQIARTQGNGFGDALGDDPGLDSRQASQRNGGTVVGVEALGFNQARAREPDAALSLWLGKALGGLFEHAWLRPRLRARRGEDPDFAVGEDAVDVEENEFNFAGAGGSGCFSHRRDSSIQPAGN